MRNLAFAALLAVVYSSSFASANERVREVNVTQGSEPGWIPSVELEAEARSVVTRYLKARSSSSWAKARAFHGESLRSMWSEDQFRAELAQARRAHGTLLAIGIRKLTWTKDSALAPQRGIYVAVDLVNSFTLTSRHCGYVILHKFTPAEPFKIARTDDNYMSKKIARSLGDKAAERWKEVSVHCPGYSPD